MLFGILIAASTAALSPACTSTSMDCAEWIKPAGKAPRTLVYRTHPLETRNEKVVRAFVFVHGILRDADNHFRTALAGAFLSGTLDDTLIVAPRFASNSGSPGNETGDCHDPLASGEANWICDSARPDTWRSGGTAIDDKTLSSFDVMDEIVRRIARKDVFPNLKTIVVAGHSAGGQFVVRYAMLSQAQDKIGTDISYLVANPSSYAYVDKLRPTSNAIPAKITVGKQQDPSSTPSSSGPAFVPFDGKTCAGYDIWPYGLKFRPRYSSALSDTQVARNLATRRVTYLLGEADVLPLGVFDTSCAAMAQGANRLTRGLAFHAYVNQAQHAHHDAIVVPFCSHSQRCIFTSDVALPLMFPK